MHSPIQWQVSVLSQLLGEKKRREAFGQVRNHQFIPLLSYVGLLVQEPRHGTSFGATHLGLLEAGILQRRPTVYRQDGARHTPRLFAHKIK